MMTRQMRLHICWVFSTYLCTTLHTFTVQNVAHSLICIWEKIKMLPNATHSLPPYNSFINPDMIFFYFSHCQFIRDVSLTKIIYAKYTTMNMKHYSRKNGSGCNNYWTKTMRTSVWYETLLMSFTKRK